MITPELQIMDVFKEERFPNIVVAVDGTVLAIWGSGNVRVRRSENGGKSWGPEIKIGDGVHGGGAVVNELNGEIFVFIESKHPPSTLSVYNSKDHGKTWSEKKIEIKPDKAGNIPSMHMNEHGIALQHGKYKGRLIRPTRYYAYSGEEQLSRQHYTNAIFSDDGGETWQTSEPFPAKGTGEASIAELSNGRIYYNSRRHWAPEGESQRKRWTAWSADGGNTWKNLSACEELPDGEQSRNYGLMGGLTRLPVEDKDILIFSNIESHKGRHHGTIWASFDGAKTWPVSRLLSDKRFSYSSLAAGRPGTKSEGWIYLLYEGGPKAVAGAIARFNLNWVLYKQ